MSLCHIPRLIEIVPPPRHIFSLPSERPISANSCSHRSKSPRCRPSDLPLSAKDRPRILHGNGLFGQTCSPRAVLFCFIVLWTVWQRWWRDTTWFCRSFEMLPSPQEPLADSKLALDRSGSPLIPSSLWLDTRRFNTDKSTTSTIRVNMGAAAMIGGGRRNLRVTFTLLLLSFLASTTLAGVIGVDLGSEFMKVSLVRTMMTQRIMRAWEGRGMFRGSVKSVAVTTYVRPSFLLPLLPSIDAFR